MINDLKGFKKTTVMKHNKAKCLGITYASHPSAYSNFFISFTVVSFINLFSFISIPVYPVFYYFSKCNEKSGAGNPLHISITHCNRLRKGILPLKFADFFVSVTPVKCIDSLILAQIKGIANINSSCFINYIVAVG